MSHNIYINSWQVTLTVDYRHRHLTVTLWSQRFSFVARSEAFGSKQISF